MGVDFKGKTNSALARPPLLERVAEICLEGVEASSLTSLQLSLWKQWTGKYPGPHTHKHPSRIFNREEVSVPARAIFIFPNPSHLNCAALPSKWAANSKQAQTLQEKYNILK